MNVISKVAAAASLALLMLLGACESECVTCTGQSFPRELCPGDYQERIDFQNDVAAYEAAGGECE